MTTLIARAFPRNVVRRPQGPGGIMTPIQAQEMAGRRVIERRLAACEKQIERWQSRADYYRSQLKAMDDGEEG